MVSAEEVKQAVKNLAVAKQQFDAADPDFIDVACHKLNAAESRLNAVYIRLKKEGIE